MSKKASTGIKERITWSEKDIIIIKKNKKKANTKKEK